MNEIKTYNTLLELRRYSKRIQQLSYSLSKIEQKFPIDDLSELQIESLVVAYNLILNELTELSSEYNIKLETTDSN